MFWNHTEIPHKIVRFSKVDLLLCLIQEFRSVVEVLAAPQANTDGDLLNSYYDATGELSETVHDFVPESELIKIGQRIGY